MKMMCGTHKKIMSIFLTGGAVIRQQNRQTVCCDFMPKSKKQETGLALIAPLLHNSW